MDYRSAGVNIAAGRAFVNKIRPMVEATHRAEVVGGFGGFGGLIRLPAGLRHPVLVSGTDGVGTKLELAQEHNGHYGVGIDLVAMCVNDVITTGAQPLFFLDYIATGSFKPEAMAHVVEGIAVACQESGCALLGGETAEMPGFYPSGRYDLAGFCVAVAEEEQLIDSHLITTGDHIVGISSSGIHSNGFSLVRHIIKSAGADVNSCFGSRDLPLFRALLTPTELYWGVVEKMLQAKLPIHGMAHITGGGLPENLPRCIPRDLCPVVDAASWPRPEIFDWLQRKGQVPERDLWHTFNMGIGFCLVLPPDTAAEEAIAICQEFGLSAWRIGSICADNRSGYVAGLPN